MAPVETESWVVPLSSNLNKVSTRLGPSCFEYFFAIESRTMFGVAAIGVSAVFGYGLYKYVSGKQNARKIKEAIDKMVSFHNYVLLLISSFFSRC